MASFADRHESYTDCGWTPSKGNRKPCEKQVSSWADDDELGVSGYWCCACGAYRGRSGDQKGRDLYAERQQSER